MLMEVFTDIDADNEAMEGFFGSDNSLTPQN